MKCRKMALTVGTCVYCAVRVRRRGGAGGLLLRPTKVLFSHRQGTTAAGELRTVVAYKNPFTGDYCVHKSHTPGTGYLNPADSEDSGLSDRYEPCSDPCTVLGPEEGVDRPRNWNYNEYQI